MRTVAEAVVGTRCPFVLANDGLKRITNSKNEKHLSITVIIILFFSKTSKTSGGGGGGSFIYLYSHRFRLIITAKETRMLRQMN